MVAVSKNSGTKQVNKKPPIQPPRRAPQQRRYQQICYRCGWGLHSRQVHPAKNAACHKCNKKGHYIALYASRNLFLPFQKRLTHWGLHTRTIWRNKTQPSLPGPVTELSDKIMLFKIDTGAKVSAMNEQTFNSMTPSALLNTLSKLLHGPSRQPFDTLGKCYSFACS